MWVLFSSLGKFQTFTRDQKYTTTEWTYVDDSTFDPNIQDIEKNVTTGQINITNRQPSTRQPSPPQTNFISTLVNPNTINTTTPSQTIPIGHPIVIEKDGLYSIDGIVGIQGTYGEMMDIAISKTPAGDTTPTEITNSKRSFLNYSGGSDTTTLVPLVVDDTLSLTLTPLTMGSKNITMATLKVIGL